MDPGAGRDGRAPRLLGILAEVASDGASARRDLVHVLQAREQAVIGAPRGCDHLKHRLKGSAIQFLIYLMPVEVYGHQAEEVYVHLLQFSHSADNMWKTNREVKDVTCKHTHTPPRPKKLYIKCQNL
ncbi:UNVERIFIED_CONTAM: hypothetical protein K2H54_060989 [Gekko kuhli]